MRRPQVLRVLPIAGLLWLLLLTCSATAFNLSNCDLHVTSTLAGGGASKADSGDGGHGASQANPFLVDPDGTVNWSGQANIAMASNSWHVDLLGVPVLSGTGSSTSNPATGSGSVSIKSILPFPVAGLYYVSGAITGSGGTCQGDGWFKLTGNPVGTVPFILGLVLLVLGLLLMAWGWRGAAFASVIGGLLAGLGGATLLVIFSALVLGAMTPQVALLGGLAAGILEAILRRRSPAAA